MVHWLVGGGTWGRVTMPSRCGVSGRGVILGTCDSRMLWGMDTRRKLGPPVCGLTVCLCSQRGGLDCFVDARFAFEAGCSYCLRAAVGEMRQCVRVWTSMGNTTGTRVGKLVPAGKEGQHGYLVLLALALIVTVRSGVKRVWQCGGIWHPADNPE